MDDQYGGRGGSLHDVEKNHIITNYSKRKRSQDDKQVEMITCMRKMLGDETNTIKITKQTERKTRNPRYQETANIIKQISTASASPSAQNNNNSSNSIHTHATALVTTDRPSNHPIHSQMNTVNIHTIVT